LPELDAMLAGGPTSQATTLLAGAPGTGKTTLALHWALADSRADASTLFVAFGERPAQLAQKAAAFGLDLEARRADGSVRVEWLSPVEPDPDVIAQRLRAAIAAAPVARLVFDDVAVLMRALGDRALDYLAALHLFLASEGIASLFLSVGPRRFGAAKIIRGEL
jgi:circadian clock protein KaiC